MRTKPFFTLFTKETKRFTRILGQTIFTPVVTSSLYLLIFGISLAKDISFNNVSYLEFLIPGLIMMGVLNNAYLNNSSTLVLSKLFGDIEDLKTAPLTTCEIITSLSLAATLRAFLVGLVIFVVSEIFVVIHLRHFLMPAHILWALLFLLLGGFTFGLFGVAVGLYSKSFETLNSISQFILLPLIYLGGVFYSIANLSPIWQTIVRFNPMFYYINALRYAFLGISDVPIFFSFSIVFLFFIALFCLTYFIAKNSSFRRI